MVFPGTLLRVRIGVGAVQGMDDRADSPAFSFASALLDSAGCIRKKVRPNISDSRKQHDGGLAAQTATILRVETKNSDVKRPTSKRLRVVAKYWVTFGRKNLGGARRCPAL